MTARESEAIVRFALRRRGIQCPPGRHEGVILPRTRAGRDRLYSLLRHYSFRLFVRDLIRFPGGAGLSELTRYCSPAVARRYAETLCEIDVARARSGRFRLHPAVHSFGPTLEWFVAEALRAEFGITSAWGLRPIGAAGGGDYDVIGCAEGALIYLELKSSPPRNIEQQQIAAFVRRVVTLGPDLAILLNDTQLRMLDKLVPALRVELRRQPFGRGSIRRVQGEIFSRGERLFLTNSEPDLIGNLAICLARFFRARSARP